MHIAVITGGPIFDEAAILLEDCDLIYCADSGADYAIRNGYKPDKVFGDFDSIEPETRVILDKLSIPMEVYPVEKDETDTEIILNSISKEDEIFLICSLTGRIDHVTANMQLLINKRKEGYRITATDGVTDLIPMSGKDSISLGLEYSENIAVSLIPMDFETECTGVTSEGLYYELNSINIKSGKTLSFSNKLKAGADSFSIKMESGNLLVCITNSMS